MIHCIFKGILLGASLEVRKAAFQKCSRDAFSAFYSVCWCYFVGGGQPWHSWAFYTLFYNSQTSILMFNIFIKVFFKLERCHKCGEAALFQQFVSTVLGRKIMDA